MRQSGLCKSRLLHFLCKKMQISNWEQDCFCHHRTVSAVKRAEFVRNRMSNVVLRGR